MAITGPATALPTQNPIKILDVQVRRAVAEDASAIAAIHVSAWQVAYRGLIPDEVLDGLSIAQRERFWADALAGAHGAGLVLVATRGGVVTGFCAVAMPSRDEDADERVAEIGAIYVDPELWRLGVGTALMAEAVAELRARGWGEVTLWVLAENHQAQAFYNRLGFQRDGAETVHDDSGRAEVRLRASLTRSRYV